jgi:branched-subunit amino acid aminotransferase/4-amino-4-deoxychorismate lyase
MKILVDGELIPEEEATVSVFDATVQRGDGCFEGIRVYRGRAFAKAEHLDRLESAAEALHMELPPRADLERWIDQVAATTESSGLRVIVTAGGRGAHPAKSRTFVFLEPLPPRPAGGIRLQPVDAPWHPAGLPWELAGVKSLSYGPNVAARREAMKAGMDDALLIGRDRVVLEGPMFTVMWWRDGVLETPTLDLGILASITRAEVMEIATGMGIEVREAVFTVDAIFEADEAFALSTSKEVLPIVELAAWDGLDARAFPMGPIGQRLLEAFRAKVDSECPAP